MTMENIKEMREEERMTARVFQVVRHSAYIHSTSLLYSLFDIFWMITMCCEVSYLYIGLLVQLSYLTYVRFLNNSLINSSDYTLKR
jgi:hypothetical protein